MKIRRSAKDWLIERVGPSGSKELFNTWIIRTTDKGGYAFGGRTTFSHKSGKALSVSSDWLAKNTPQDLGNLLDELLKTGETRSGKVFKAEKPKHPKTESLTSLIMEASLSTISELAPQSPNHEAKRTRISAFTRISHDTQDGLSAGMQVRIQALESAIQYAITSGDYSQLQDALGAPTRGSTKESK